LNWKWFPLLLVILLAIAVFVIKSLNKKDSTDPAKRTTAKPKDPASGINRDHGFDRRISFISYSGHAKCRMQCRTVTQAEVEQIMRDGSINYRKSDLKNARCPRYALEGNTNDGQKLRIIFAQCNETTAVVTVIDLDKDFVCNCPGDDVKYENK